MEIDKKAIAAIFADDVSWLEALKVTVSKGKTETTVTISKMYSHVPMGFKEMKKLAELLGTEDFNINHWHQDGCETCDYGSKYSQEITIPNPKVEAPKGRACT